MHFAWTSLGKDLARWRRDYLAFLLWLSIPLLIGGLLTVLMGNDVRPRGVLLIVDDDQTLLSGLVAKAYSGGQLGEFLSVETVAHDDGLARIDDGEASGLLVIPKGFSDAMLGAEPVTLTLLTNPSQSVLPGIIREVTEILLDGGFYAHQLFADEIAAIRGANDGFTDAQVAMLSVAIRNKLEAAVPRLFPPLIDIEIADPPPAEPSPPLALLFLPGIVMMAVLFAANGLASDFWQERTHGTLRRIVAAPVSLLSFVAGKALAAAVVIGAVGGIALALGFLYHGIGWLRFPVSLLWVSISGVALFSWFSALQMLFRDRRAANVVSTALLFPLLMAGGSFFPLAVMPGWMAAIGRVSPNGYVGERLAGVMTAADAWGIDASSWFAVAAAAAAGLALCAWRLRAGFARA